MRPVNLEWGRLLHVLTDEGELVSPRGLPCREVIGHQSRVDMMRPILVCPARKISYRFMCGEAWWITSGRNDVESVSRYAKNIKNFSDNGTSFFGAYGPQLHEQLPYVVEMLRRDPDSRQAVVNIWRERPPQTRDVPCTLSWQFLIRRGLLHCNASMRSSDAWLGWPYDVFNFSMVSWLVASHLGSGMRLGQLTLTAGSQHLYASNDEAVARVSLSKWGPDSPRLDLSSLSTNEIIDGLKVSADEQWDLLPVSSPFRIFQDLKDRI